MSLSSYLQEDLGMISFCQHVMSVNQEDTSDMEHKILFLFMRGHVPAKPNN